MLRWLKKIVLGPPLKTAQAIHERLSNPKALAVFSSDALSSVAYATEEILLVLVLAGSAMLNYSLYITSAILALMVVVGFSYRQTIFAYPTGGGAYTVAKENLGVYPGLIAGAALLIDYVLTVAVSVASGVAAITSAFPNLYEHRVLLCLLAIGLVTMANLRGVRESGNLFAAPTYLFAGSIGLLIGVGLFRFISAHGAVPLEPVPMAAAEPLTAFLLLRAFSSGCAALTGVEAISNGVQAFRAPEDRNASRTLIWMLATLMTLFAGISVLAFFYGLTPTHDETVVSSIARQVFGSSPLYYLVQAATAMILVLAANTSYADFPRLASLIARDGFIPQQFAYRGDRLVFSNGILALGAVSGILVYAFQGETHRLIPLYAVGVFLSFTLSQSGMVRHWFKDREPGWKSHALINGIGAATTGVVMVIITLTKFTHGAWVVVALIPILVLIFRGIHGHYAWFKQELALDWTAFSQHEHTFIVPISSINKSVVAALQYAKSLAPDNVVAVHVSLDPEKAKRLKEQWETYNFGIKLVVLHSPYRSVVGPLINFIERIERRDPNHMVTLLLPEFVTAKWWHALLHNQTTLYIKAALMFHRGLVVISFPYHLAR